MRALSIHHIGHAVADLDSAIATYDRLFGARLEHRETVPDQGVEAATMLVGGDRVELLRPLAADTPVGRFLERRGPGMHHVALRVADIESALREAGEAGAELIDETPRSGLFGLLVELVQLPEGNEHD
jgi:methylmalonyl-CoA/ethylmalonyl-CoA epimerase